MQATTTGRMSGQPSILIAMGALLIATTLLVGVAIAQRGNFGTGTPAAAAPAVYSNEAVQQALTQVRQDEHDGLSAGWATNANAGAAVTPTRPVGHVGLSEIASGTAGIDAAIAPTLPVGNWGLSEIRRGGETLSPDSPSYSELVNQRKGEKDRLAGDAPAAPDRYERAGFSIR